MLWKPINGNTFKTAQFGYEDYLGWHTYVLDYDNLTYSTTSEITWENEKRLVKKSYSKGKILSPKIFAKKEVKKKVVTEILDSQIVQILDMNCMGRPPIVWIDNGTAYPTEFEVNPVNVSATFEIDFEGGHIYTTLGESYNPKGNKNFKSNLLSVSPLCLKNGFSPSY